MTFEELKTKIYDLGTEEDFQYLLECLKRKDKSIAVKEFYKESNYDDGDQITDTYYNINGLIVRNRVSYNSWGDSAEGNSLTEVKITGYKKIPVFELIKENKIKQSDLYEYLDKQEYEDDV